MGLYLNTGLCLARQGGKVARLHRKLRYLCAILRTLPCLTKPLLTLSRQCCSHALLLPPLPRTPTTKALPKFSRSETGGFGRLPGEPHRNTHVGGVIRTPCSCLSAARACSSSSPRSTSSREAFRGEAPVGIWEESKSTLQLGYFGERLGESFHYLSRHINTYFKGPAMPLQTLHGRAELMGGERKPRGRAQRRALTQNPANERVQVECGESVRLAAQRGSVDQNEEPPPIQAAQGLQLFHISSLTTRFGESYSYVARHINSVFSTGLTQEVQPQSGTDRTRGRRRRRRTTSHVGGESKGSDLAKLTEVQGTEQDSGSVKTDDSKTWEESYRHFAHRINSYFGAKVTDMTQEPAAQERAWFSTGAKVSQSSDHSSPPDSDLRRDSPCPATNQDAGTLQPKSPGLFHISSLATSFGESYAQMANHINCYFKGVAGWEGEAEEGERVEPGDWQDMGDTTVPNQQGALSFIQSLLQPGTSISDLLGSSLWAGTREQMAPTTPTASPVEAVWSRQVVSRKEAEERTRVLVKRLQQAASPTSLSTCIEELNEHLILYPACKAAAWQEKTVLVLLGQRRFHRDNQELQDAIREALALIGYVDSVKGRGIRILSIDGGGTRGVVPLQLLKRLEVATGRQVHQLFDYICGVSTGAVLAFMLGLERMSLDECEEMYRRFGSDVFRQNPLVGTMKMGWSHSYYNTATWEGLLREKMGNKVLIKSSRDQLSPKVSAVSAVVNWGTTPKAFVFRNYNHAPGRLSRYAGASGYQLWQAVRASSAAPGYFQEFQLHSDIHQDGALIFNNPCALAVHECRLLWPSQPFQCVLSLGTGRYDNAKRGPATSTSLRAKISNLISSATDTEGVHTLLDDLLSANVYFRFNPMLSAEVSLDDSRPGALDLLRADTQLYLNRNQHKVERLCKVLSPERRPLQLAGDRIGERVWELWQRWA